MRHAKSSWKYPDLSDHERPLKKRGRKASVKIAKELIKLEWIPDKLYSCLLYTSPSPRDQRGSRMPSSA